MKKQNLPTWDLEKLYASADDWERDFKRVPELAADFAAFRGHLADSPAQLCAAIEASDALQRLEEKLYTYAHLRSDEDTSINANRARVSRLETLFAELAPQEAWFDPELLAIPDDAMEKMLKAKELALYERSIRELLREKPHTLSEPEERLLGSFSDVFGTGSECFEVLNDTDLDFGSLRDEKGKMTALTHANYIRFVESPDRRVRRSAYMKLYHTYRQFRNTFAATLDGNVKLHVAEARVRHYPSALAASLSGDDVPESVYRNLISTVHDNLAPFYDYTKLRCEALKLKKLAMYDIYTPLVPQCRCDYSFEEAARLVREALAPLGEEYAAVLERAFSERWIHAPECKGKRSGAYSSGCFDSYPYLLLSFNGTLNDVFTLAHELGHSMHSYFSWHNQPYHYASYEIFVAEVASITNEVLLYEHLKKTSPTPEFRAYLTGHLADEIRATLYRQTMFAEFELAVHELAESGEPLTADLLNGKYAALNALYYGPHVRQDDLIALEWSRIPHFYYNFYVYKYATGMAAALKLARNLLSGDAKLRGDYFGFLKAGDSRPVLEIMRGAGVDLSKSEPVRDALDYFDGVVRDLRTELAAIGRI